MVIKWWESPHCSSPWRMMRCENWGWCTSIGGIWGNLFPLLYIDIVNTGALLAQRGEDLKLQSNYTNNYHFRLHIFIALIFIYFYNTTIFNGALLSSYTELGPVTSAFAA